MSEPQVHFEVLPNGLTVLAREAHVAPVAEIQIWAKVGSADEGPGEAGLAHFHEHMLFKGTGQRGVGEVAAEIEGEGGRINAYTSFDMTVYHATLPSESLEVGMGVLSDAVRHSVFDPDEVAREIEVVLEEIRRSKDSPHHVLGEALFAEAYRSHPYRAPILGTSESVAGFTQAKLLDFYRRWYTPENLLVVVVGDFETGRAVDLVAKAFESAEPGQARRNRPLEPPQEELRSCILQRSFERASLELGWASVNFHDPDAPLLDLLSFILGEGDSSRLVVRVKENEGLCDRIDAGSYTPLDRGLFSVSVDLDPARAREAIVAVTREVERLRLEPVGIDELEKARTNFLAHQYFERESVSGMARKMGSFQAIAGDYRLEKNYFDAIREAAPEDLLRVAQHYLGSEHLSVGAVLPEQAADGLDHSAVADAVAQGVERTRKTFAPPSRAARSATLVSYLLPNGAQLHVLPRREVPVVAARAAFLGGQLAETEETAGLTSLLSGMWLRGTRARSNSELARAIESLASDVDGFSGRNSLGLTLEVSSDKLAPTLDLFAEVLLEPAFDPEEFERERHDVLAAIERREDRLGSRCFDLFGQAHYRHHPYRFPVIGTEETVRSFTPELVRAHYQRLVRAPNLCMAISGDVDPDAVASAIATRLVNLEGGPFDAPAPKLEPAPGEVRRGELKKDRAQSHLVLGFRGLTVDDPDRDVLEVIAQLLAGQGGRLFLELRDRRSLAYSVTAVSMEGVAPGFFAVYIATAPDKFEQARQGMLDELERLLQEGPAEAELERTRRYLVGNFAIDEQRNSARAAHVSLDALYGLGADAHEHHPDRVRAVTRDDVLRVARRVIDFSAYTEAVIRGGGPDPS